MAVSEKMFSLKPAAKFEQKYWLHTTASFAPFILCWQLCALCKLVGEIDSS
jgi:hypothetical protein